MVVLPSFSCVGELVQVSVVSADQEANRPLPGHLEDIVTGSHSFLGDLGRATLRNILHKYVHVFLAPGEPVTRRTRAVNMILKPMEPSLFSVGHVAWHRLVSGHVTGR